MLKSLIFFINFFLPQEYTYTEVKIIIIHQGRNSFCFRSLKLLFKKTPLQVETQSVYKETVPP